MKNLYFLMLFPFFSIGQTQVGSDIIGENLSSDVRSVSFSNNGNIVAVGTPIKNSGFVRVYENVSGAWIQIGNDIIGEADGDESGASVSLSADGNILAIGSPLNDGNGSDSGSVRVYQNISSTWVQIGNDINGLVANDQYGYYISLSNDGNTLAVSALNSVNGIFSGSVRIYENVSGTWTQIGNEINGVAFGDKSNLVSLSGDGKTVAVGATSSAYVNPIGVGYVRVFENITGVWTQIGNIIDGFMDNRVSSICLSNNGIVLAVGYGNGVVRTYKNTINTWTQIGSDINADQTNDLNGYNVSLSNDGNIIALGAFLNDTNGKIDSGIVRIFKFNTGNWNKIGNNIEGKVRNEVIGKCISISGNGDKVIFGSGGKNLARVYDLSQTLSSNNFILNDFSLYPNPASEIVNIKLEENIILEKVFVYNILGQLVKTEKNNAIIVDNLAKGSYFFEIFTNKGKATVKMLLK
jgi:Secretion system C-terminal sorting domain